MTLEEDIRLTNKYNELHNTINIVDACGEIKVFTIASLSHPIHFEVVKKKDDNENYIARISMESPEYLDGDLILTDAEIDIVINIINIKWKFMIDIMNKEAKYFTNNWKEIDYINIPDYNLLKRGI